LTQDEVMTIPLSTVSVIDTVNAIRNILNIEQNLTGHDYLKVFIKNISTELGVKYVFVGHTSESRPDLIQTDVVCMDGRLQPNFKYELENTPCEIVMSGERVCVHEHSVCKSFPNDILLETMRAESYAGSPAISVNGDLMGILVLADDKPMSGSEQLNPTIEFLAQRITAEYERYNIEQGLHKIIEKRTKELEASNAYLRKSVEELELAKRELEYKHRTDALTHVHTREWFTDLAMAQLKMAKRNQYPLSLLFIDLDYFKKINDTYGHTTGDIVLEEAAARIKRCVRETDILGRFGGEEFILLSPYTDSSKSVQLAERIKNEISSIPIQAFSNDISITTSIGIAASDIDICELENLIEHADAALYQAKDSGRNACVLYN